METLPRKIWFCWFDGLEQAPPLIRHCFRSWQRHNPGWDVIFLHDGNLLDYVDASCGCNMAHLTVQKRANLLRLALLDTHGGVWADATCFCTRPLDRWIGDCMDTGFFCFQADGPGRVMGNWFMAAMPGNELVRSFRQTHLAYWRDHRFRDPDRLPVRLTRALLNRICLLREGWTGLWFSPFVTDTLAMTTYFAFQYQFARHLRQHAASAAIFNGMPCREAEPLLRPGRMGRGGTAIAELKSEIEQTRCPLYKLDWKRKLFDMPVAEALATLFPEVGEMK